MERTVVSFLVFSFAVLFVEASFADICICETMKQANEEAWYKKGCSLWYERQTDCSQRVDREFGRFGEFKKLEIPDDWKGQKIRLGYVGHWQNSNQTIDYVNSVLVPAMKKTGASLVFDNTACSGLSDAEAVQSHLKNKIKTQLSEGQTLTILGHQVTSIGLWDTVLGTSYNLAGQVSSGQERVKYPQCDPFVGKPCLDKNSFLPWTQIGQAGYCWKDQDLIQIRCLRRFQDQGSRVAEVSQWVAGDKKANLDREKAILEKKELSEVEKLTRLGILGVFERRVPRSFEIEINAGLADVCHLVNRAYHLEGKDRFLFKNNKCLSQYEIQQIELSSGDETSGVLMWKDHLRSEETSQVRTLVQVMRLDKEGVLRGQLASETGDTCAVVVRGININGKRELSVSFAETRGCRRLFPNEAGKEVTDFRKID